MQEMQNKKLIVVLGMHRSGTSAVTRSLRTLGVELGDALVPAVAGDNDKGFWEDVDTLSINQELMCALEVSWCPLSPYRWSRIDAEKMRGFRRQAIELLQDKLKNASAFGLKDPRLTRLLVFWQPIFRELGVDVHYLLVVRNPLSVAASLKRRNGFDEFRSHMLWLRHVVPSFLDTCGSRRIVVSYERMMADPAGQLHRLGRGLDMPVDEHSEAFTEFTRDFLSPELQHAHHTIDELDRDDVPVQLRHVYAALEGMAADEILDGDPAIYELFMDVDRYLSGMENSLAYIDQLEERNEKLQHTVPSEVADRLAELESAYDALAKGKAWLESQRDAWEELAAKRGERVAELAAAVKDGESLRQMVPPDVASRLAELECAYDTLAHGQVWLESQRDAWQKLAESREQLVAELTAALKEYEEGNAWLESQRQAWEVQARTYEARLLESEKLSTEPRQQAVPPEVAKRLIELESAYDTVSSRQVWLESQRDAWEKLAESREQRIAELTAALKKYEEGNTWLESQRQAWEMQAKAYEARLLESERQATEPKQDG